MIVFFVTPWYGQDIPGGMEAETRRTAAKLMEAGYEIEILTTCIRDFQADWDKNFHRPGVHKEGGLTIHRFPVTRVDRNRFRDLNWRLERDQLIDGIEEKQFINNMISCPGLLDYIAECDQDARFFFIPYLFSTTVYGAAILPQHSAVIPCLHDESYAYLGLYKDVFSKVRAMVFHTEAERRLAAKLFGLPEKQLRPLIGEGVETSFSSDPQRFRQKFNLNAPFVLVAGRKEPGKNTPLLLHYWRRYQEEAGRDLILVFIGPGDLPIDDSDDPSIIDLGYVSLQDKYDAYAAAMLLCQPSVHESFSLVIMEAWVAGTPVLVNGNCQVTREHCHRSNGGLYFENFEEFAATLDSLANTPDMRREMGANGRKYVLEHYQWPQIVDKYVQLIEEMNYAK